MENIGVEVIAVAVACVIVIGLFKLMTMVL